MAALAAAALAAATPSVARANVVRSFGPVADAYVTSAAPNAHTFRSRRLHVGSRPARRAYLRFQVRGVTGPVPRAVLRVWALNRSSAGFDVRISTRQRWTSQRLTFRTAPRPGAVIARSGPFGGARWVSVAVTPVIHRSGTLSLVLTSRSSHMIALASREAGPRFAPRLIIRYGTPATGPGAGATGAPAATAPPSITGTALERQVLTAQPGGWRGAEPIAFAYQWRRCKASGNGCANISKARGSTYVLTGKDVGYRLRVVVTATNAAGSAQQVSDPTPVIAAAPAAPSATSLPAISGTPEEGQTLKASAGSWRGTKPITFGYQWRRCDRTGAACADVPGATAVAYTLSSADVGATIRLAITAANAAGTTTVVSKATKVIAAAAAPITRTVSLWHMDDTSGNTMTDAVGANPGTADHVAFGQPGFLNGAFAFDGSSSVIVVPSSDTLNPGAAPFAVTVHVQLTQTPNQQVGDYDLIRKGLSSTVGGEYKMEILGTGQAFCHFQGSGGSNDVQDGPNLADGAWHTIQCVKRDSSVSLVVDGHTYSRNGAVGAIANTAPLSIGAKSEGADWYLGLMDEVTYATA
jgi:hypothetical protein